MAQASASALLRRLRRHCDPAGPLLRRRFLSSASAPHSYSAGATGPNKLGGRGGLSSWAGSHPRRPGLASLQHAAAAATSTRSAHQAASSSESPTVAAAASRASSHSEAVRFIKSAFGKLEGQHHCWLNATNGVWRILKEDGVYLILLYRSCETLDSNGKCSSAFEKLKYLQRRYPLLNVLAVQYGSDASSLAAEIHAVQAIMKEYITFPILKTDRDFTNMTGACYLLLEGSKDPLLFPTWHEEPEVMIKAVEELSALKEEPSEDVLSRVSWQKEEAIKEPYVGSFRNLLLNHPACLSVDKDGDRLFISDSNHHRLIISDSNGRVMDCIGSLPGFEDGEFESAKFLRPAASFYHAPEDCLYIVDSENHAVRKADLGRRIVETVYPVFNKGSGILSWIIDKLGLKKDAAPTIQDFDADMVALPWHLIQISEDNLLLADRNFEASWTLRVSTGEKLDIGRGRAEVMESYQQTVNERCALLKDVHAWSSHAKGHSDLLDATSSKELVSSVARFQNYIVFCDTDGQRVLKHNLDTKNASSIHFSNCDVLGLPYWFVCNLERVSTWGHSTGQFQEHIRQVDVLPGKCNITVYADIPADTGLAAPLSENCIWRHVRGSGAEISGSDGPETTTEKVGIAQQWYDELDNLAFSEVASEEPVEHEGDGNPAEQSYQDLRTVQFTCTVNVSPGICELVASAALYLKMAARRSFEHGEQKAVVKRMMGSCQGREEHAGVELLLMGRRGSGADARDLVVAKPVHLRLRLQCADHPAGATNKETISTESSVKINIALE